MAKLQLKNVRLAFPDLFKVGKPQNDGDTPKYGGSFIFEEGSDTHNEVKAAMIAVAQEVFGPNWQAIVGAMEKTKKCLRKGNDNLDKEGVVRNGFADHWYVVARNKAKPAVIGAIARKPDGTWNTLTEADGKPYGGCYVNVKIDIQAMKAKDKMPNQIYARLEAVQFVRDGEAFGAGPGTPEGFDDADGAAIDANDGDLF